MTSGALRYALRCVPGDPSFHPWHHGVIPVLAKVKECFSPLKCQNSVGSHWGGNFRLNACLTSWKSWHSRLVMTWKYVKLIKPMPILAEGCYFSFLCSFYGWFFFSFHFHCFSHHTEVCSMPESLLDETRQPGDGFVSTVSQSPDLNYYFVNPMSVRDETDNGSQEVPLSPA